MGKVWIDVIPRESWESPQAREKIRKATQILAQFNYKKDGSSTHDHERGIVYQRWKVDREDLGDVMSKLMEFLDKNEYRVFLGEDD